MRHGAFTTLLAAAATLPATAGVCAETAGPGDRVDALPKALEGVGVDERLDAELPLDLAFTDWKGQPVRLGDYFRAGRPVILSLNYSSCPMLCSLQLTGLSDSLKKLDAAAGTDFEIVSVSIDPTEKPHRAAETRQKYLQHYGRGAGGWNFLVGRRGPIERLADAVGFRYQYVPERREYAHAAVAILCTPDGRVSRYLYGFGVPEQTLRLSLVEASEGKIGTAGDQLLLFCFHYDPLTGTYAPRAARFAMSVAGCLTVLVLGAVVLTLRSRDPNRPAPAVGPPDPN